MPLVPLSIPPGVYRNGTQYQSAGRWYDANFVRWADGTMRPIGGWRARVTLGTTAPRALLAWRDLASDRNIAAGFHDKLVVANTSNVVTDITPADLAVGDLSAASNTGFGGGLYGRYAYSTPRPDIGEYTEATTWSLDNWGQNLVACSSWDGRLLEWDLNPANNAAPIANAPVDNRALVVTEERFLFALGAGGNARKVQWCDRENNTVWAPLATNEAGDIELATPGQIMLGIRARGQTLILTDWDAHVATYQGPPFVYGFERVGSACGAISRKAAATTDTGVLWMGAGAFHIYAGGQVEEIPCDVADYVFGDMNMAQASKVCATSNSANTEVWWFYPSAGSSENDRYVAYNYAERHWSIGALARTAAVDRGSYQYPMFAGADGVIYEHEVGLVSSEDVFAETGPIEISGGEQVMSAVELIPDEKTQGDVRAVFTTRFHPNDALRTYGPYSMANPTPVRFTGRQVQMRLEGAKMADWRVGVPRLDVRPGGRR